MTMFECEDMREYVLLSEFSSLLGDVGVRECCMSGTEVESIYSSVKSMISVSYPSSSGSGSLSNILRQCLRACSKSSSLMWFTLGWRRLG